MPSNQCTGGGGAVKKRQRILLFTNRHKLRESSAAQLINSALAAVCKLRISLFSTI